MLLGQGANLKWMDVACPEKPREDIQSCDVLHIMPDVVGCTDCRLSSGHEDSSSGSSEASLCFRNLEGQMQLSYDY